MLVAMTTELEQLLANVSPIYIYNIYCVWLTLTAIVEGFRVLLGSSCEILKPRWWSLFDAKNIEGSLIYKLFSTTKKGEQPIKANCIILGLYMQREQLFILKAVQTVRIAVYVCYNTLCLR